MRTLLSRFSDEFVRALRPLLDPLEQAAETLARASPEVPGREALPDLRELRHQLQVLVDKVEDQHAFVLIFGPLKSGKSTLMNALSAAYVSEVSSLPAYPCMVYVSHASELAFEVTRYDGTKATLADPLGLKAFVERAHGELVQALHRAEDAGAEFDPALHFPQAIRRIDVRVPAPALERSGAVLVDTPGLYSRMKFGYDRMTRDFRNAAASAIFVVKSDNLFLEQVFDEFHALLDLFSRIFLVINIDSAKLDLGPGGELVPSLEQSDPARVVEAFKTYAMSAPLQRAAEEGRLRLYPIDLLRAARARLQNAHAGAAASDAASAEASSAGEGFGEFLGDLTQFLNSTDYMVAFIDDSLRRADSLLGETEGLLERDGLQRVGAELAIASAKKRSADRRREAVERLSAFGWEGAFDDFEQKLAHLVRERMRVGSEQTSDALDGALDEWFANDASLQTLAEDRLKPLFKQHHEVLSSFVQETLSREASGVAGGIAVTPEITAELGHADIRADELARRALRGIKNAVPPPPLESPFAQADIPVRRRLADWLLLRRRSTVQRRLFGPASRPSLRITRAEKEARLGREGKQALKAAIDAYKGEFYEGASAGVRESVLAQYATGMSRSLRQTLQTRQAELVGELAELDARVAELGRVQERLDRLRATQADARAAVLALDEGRRGGELFPQPRRSTADAPARADPADGGSTPSGVEPGPAAWSATS